MWPRKSFLKSIGSRDCVYFSASFPLWNSSWGSVVLVAPQPGEVSESEGNGMLSSRLTSWCHLCYFCQLQMPHSPCQEPTSNPAVVPWALKATGPCRISTYSSLHLPTIIISRGRSSVRAATLPETLRKIIINI